MVLTPRRAGSTLVIAAEGRLGAATAPTLAERLADAIADGNRRILLDLKGLDYISSAGILALEAVAARLRTDGGTLIVCRPTPPVRLALELAGCPPDIDVSEELDT